MYVGRVVSIGRNRLGRLVAMYRVSSRSFPNRRAEKINNTVAILPKEGYEEDIFKNPYIAYNCLRLVGNRYVVIGNGSHTDPIAEKLDINTSMRDALISVLFGMDYEHDAYKTPRIAAIIDKESSRGYLSIVKENDFVVREIEMQKGEAFYIATYEHCLPSKDYYDNQFDVSDVDSACNYILGEGVFADLKFPITAVTAMETDKGFDVAFKEFS